MNTPKQINTRTPRSPRALIREREERDKEREKNEKVGGGMRRKRKEEVGT